MKSKKIISLLAVAALSASAFVSLTAQAADVNGEDRKAADSKPEIVATLTGVDAENYAMMQFKLVNNEALSYEESRTGITSNGINAIQVKLTLDENVFDVSTTYVSSPMTTAAKAGDGKANVAFVFAPTTPGAYMIDVPEYLFQVDAQLKDGYTKDNVPPSAIKWDACKVEYKAYAGVKVTAGATNYTIYGANTGVAVKDYEFTVKCDDTFKDEVIPTTYNVTVGDVANGTVTVDKATAAEGETVTVTATAAEGYELEAITVDGTAIEGNTFTMPAKDVTVAATFKAVVVPPVETTVDAEAVGEAKTDEEAGIKYTPFKATVEKMWTKIMMTINGTEVDVTAKYTAPEISGAAVVGVIVKSKTDTVFSAPVFVFVD